jgi:hypothetical protein
VSAVREIRYVGVPWQVTVLPDGTREFSFRDPDGTSWHVLPLNSEMAQSAAAQLGGKVEDIPPPEENEGIPGT